MSRRHDLKHIFAAGRDERASLGDAHVDVAIGNLNRTAQATAALLATYGPNRADTLRMLFRDESLAKLLAVRGMVKTLGNTREYDLGTNAFLSIDFEGANVPAIEPSVLHMQGDRIQPLATFIAETRAVHDRFEEAKAVLRWLNRNATPGAIRYYWPTAMKVCPKSKVWEDLQEVPSRYTTPEAVGDWLQSLKDSAATVAASALLPNDLAPRARATMWLTFKARRVDLSERSYYTTDQMVYNL